MRQLGRRRAPTMPLVLVLAVTGCGRLGFDAVDVSPADADVDVSGDGGLATTPTPIYRSVGPGNLTALASGPGNPFTLSGSTATFTTALPARVGVGDALEYDSDGDSVADVVAFIHGRTSPTVFVLAAEDGGAPPSATPASTDTWSLHRAYTSLADAVTGAPNPSITIPFDTWTAGRDLVAANETWHLACYADALEQTATVVMGWTTSPSHYLRVFSPYDPEQVGTSQRHGGAWDPSRFTIALPATSNDRAIYVIDTSIRIEGLQIFVDGDGVTGDLPYGIDLRDFTTNVAHVSASIIRSNGQPRGQGALHRGIKILTTAPTSFYVWNNVVYDIGDATAGHGVELNGAGGVVYVYNNTFVNIRRAITADSGEQAVARNNVAVNCFGMTTTCIEGAGSFTGSHNATSDASALTLGLGTQLSSGIPADYFASVADFHVSPVALYAQELIDMGSDLASDPDLPFDRDIDGDVRAAPWDLGADQQ